MKLSAVIVQLLRRTPSQSQLQTEFTPLQDAKQIAHGQAECM